jgi:hypothetical protein
LYLDCGTQLVLDVDPARRTIFAHDPTRVTTFADGATFEHAATPGLRFEITPLFDRLLRRTDR